MTAKSLTRVVLVMSILLFLLLLKEACTVGLVSGIIGTIKWSENHEIRSKKDGAPVIRPGERAILQQYDENGEIVEGEVNTSQRQQLDLMLVPRDTQGQGTGQRSAPAGQQSQQRNQQAADPCATQGIGCPPSDGGLQPVVQNNYHFNR